MYRCLIAATCLYAALSFAEAESRPVPTTFPQAVGWLRDRSTKMIHDCRRATKGGIAAFPPQVGNAYDAFWLRDYAYMLEGNPDAFSDKEVEDAYRFFLAGQRADGACVDSIKFDGTPVYMPGNIIGRNAVADGSQFLVDVGWHTFGKTHDKKLIVETADKLIAALRAVPRNPANGLVHIAVSKEIDRAPYGFTDTVHKQGDELFCSLLFVQACRQLDDLLTAVNRPDEARPWHEEALRVTESVNRVFWDNEIGLYLAATDVCRQPDLWGSAFSVSIRVADADRSKVIATYFDQHYPEIVKHGQLRHLPAGMFWQSTTTPPGIYQNGGYWATPVGWLVQTLDLVDPKRADQTIIDLVADFIRRGDENECVNDAYQGVPHYLDSATLPLAGIRQMKITRMKK